MAFLKKEQYEARERNAARRNAQNEEIGISSGMTKEQAGLITDLCSLRHRLHCNIDHLIISGGGYDEKELIRLNAAIRESGLDCMDFIPTEDDDYIDIDTIDELYEYDDVPEDDDARKEWYDENYDRIYDDWEELNRKIESYLQGIDHKYGTSFAPSGILRML